MSELKSYDELATEMRKAVDLDEDTIAFAAYAHEVNGRLCRHITFEGATISGDMSLAHAEAFYTELGEVIEVAKSTPDEKIRPQLKPSNIPVVYPKGVTNEH